MNFKMIGLIVGLFIVFAPCLVTAQEEVDFTEASSVQFSYNFGETKESDKISHTFKILNNSQFIWQIKTIMTSCGCVSANLVDENEEMDKDISPGEVFQIEVKLDTAGYEGNLQQFVYVDIMQENETKILKLIMEGEIILKAQSLKLEQLLKESGLRSLNKETIEFTLPDLKGNNISLRDYKGKVVLLNFWTIWCPNCVKERAYLEKLYQKFKNEDFVLSAINVKESKNAVEKFVNKYNLNFPHLLDKKGEVSQKYNILFLPTSFIINKEGWVVSEVIGLRRWTDEPIINLLEYLLKQ